MSNLSTRHPDEGVLLRFVDGEFPARKARQIEKHLQACWQCRTEIEELKATVADCVHYRKNVLEANLPEPPNAWADLSREFDRIDASFAAEPFWKNLLPRPRAMRWSLAAAGALALAFGVFYQLRETPSVHAAAILKRAVAAASERPQPKHRIRIRTRNQEFIRAAFDTTLPPALHARLAAARYDSANPLSAQAFQAWRESLPIKTDEISTVAGPQTAGDCYRLQTSTSSGDLATATLTLRTADLHPVQEMLEFRDRNWIEFTELTEPPAVSDGSTVARNVEVPVRPSVPSGTAAFAPKESASTSDELQVLSALHQIGADLGDPIEVKRSGDRVLVGGVGVPANRQKQIHDMLDGLPHVSVNFANPPAVSSGVPATSGEAAVSETPRPAPATKAQTRLEQQLGGRAEFERFSSQILDTNEAVLARAYALRALAQRFAPAQESALTPADRRELHAMAREHAAALAAQFAGIQRILNPVLSSLGTPIPNRSTAAASIQWQPAAEDLFRSSRRVEVLLSMLLGVAPDQNATADVPAQLASAIGDLKAGCDQLQRLLAGE